LNHGSILNHAATNEWKQVLKALNCDENG